MVDPLETVYNRVESTGDLKGILTLITTNHDRFTPRRDLDGVS